MPVVSRGTAANRGAVATTFAPHPQPTTTTTLTHTLQSLHLQLPDGRKVKSVHVAARIKLPPPSKGLQASLYMLPVQNKYGAWPASGEVRSQRGAACGSWFGCCSTRVWSGVDKGAGRG